MHLIAVIFEDFKILRIFLRALQSSEMRVNEHEMALNRSKFSDCKYYLSKSD